VDERRMLDYMVFARHQEELDQLKNDANLHKLVMYGVEVEGIFEASKGPERDNLIKIQVAKIFGWIDAAYEKEFNRAGGSNEDVEMIENAANVNIKFVRHLNANLERQRPARQIIEVRLASPQESARVRGRFGTLAKGWRIARKTPTEFAGLSITNCVTKETRVRIDIMQAIVKVIKANSPLDAYVIQHIPRPLVKVINRHQMSNRSYGFTEIIAYVHSNFPGKLSDQDLLAAYNKAGSKYGPEISHYFVVLKGRDYPLTSR